MRRTKVLAGVVAGGCTTLALAVLPASAAEDDHSSVRGSTGNDFATLTVDAHNTGTGTAATGWFEADGDLAKLTAPALTLPIGATGVFHLEGPVTCLDVRGSRAGLIYPVTSASGTVGKFVKGMAVYITMVDGGPGKPDKMGFVGPAPLGSLTVCPPLATFLTSTSGDVVVTDVD
jgi:hypothetical protein